MNPGARTYNRRLSRRPNPFVKETAMPSAIRVASVAGLSALMLAACAPSQRLVGTANGMAGADKLACMFIMGNQLTSALFKINHFR